MTKYDDFYDSNAPFYYSKKTKVPKKERCSTNLKVRDIIKYAKQLNKLRKEASEKVICLDELESVAKEICNE